MPYTDNISLEEVYTAASPSFTYSYANIDTTDSLADQAQLQLRWELVTVTDDQGDPVQVAELPAGERTQIVVVDPVYYTVNPSANTITVDYDELSGSEVTVTDAQGGTATYTRPNFSVINNTNPVKIRRSVDITEAVVAFQGGSRLTSDQLNAAVQQLLFASQELTEFGSASGAENEVDLSSESINSLGDVDINLGNTGAILVIGPNGDITDSTTGGTNAVLSVNAKTGAVVLSYLDVGAAPTVHTHVMTDITDLDISGVGGVDVATTAPVAGDALVFDGTNWVPAQPVTVASGTGAPPAAWTNDPSRRPGDLYVRTG